MNTDKTDPFYHIKRLLAIAAASLAFLGIMILMFFLFFRNTGQKRGVYDPQGIFSTDSHIHYELSYFGWGVDNGRMLTTLRQQLDRGRMPIVTVEPWPIQLVKDDTPANVLESVADGTYDNVIEHLCTDLSLLNTPLIVRWGHEMEINSHRYPWSGKNPASYRRAYAHFVAACRSFDSHHNLSFMWSPSGETQAEMYWPGSDVVDLIGVSVFSFDLWDKKYLGSKRSFQEIFYPKYMRLKKYNKPIIIAEMGITGTEAYKSQWLKDAVFKAKFYKNLIGYVYFNSSDVEGAWDRFLPVPDWTIRHLP